MRVPGKFPNGVSVTLKDEKACPLFIGRHIHGVKNGPSPQWLQDRLKGIGLRPISALVDITNFLTVALNRPLHVLDADKLKGGDSCAPVEKRRKAGSAERRDLCTRRPDDGRLR